MTHGINVTGLMPGGGALGEAVRAELAARGMRVLDAAVMANLLANKGLSEFSFRPEHRSLFKTVGIDAILVVRGSVAGTTPSERVSAFVESTGNGQRLAGLTWQNLPVRTGCAVDGAPDKAGEREAACDIADELIRQLGP